MANSGIHRLNHTFTSGELSPRFGARLDFDRRKNGCKKLRNMTCLAQGPATRRPGFKFIYDLNRLGIDVAKARVRKIPFEFSEDQAYALTFFEADSGEIFMVVGYHDALVEGTGTTVDYTLEDSKTYEGTGVAHSFIFPSGETLTGQSVYLIDASDVETEVDPADYTTAVTDGSLEVTVTTGTGEFIKVIMELTTASVPAGDVVALDLPVGFDIEEFDYSQSLDEIYIAQANMRPIVIIRRSIEHWSWAPIEFSCFPEEWPRQADATPDYAATSGWPGTVTFHQQRLCWGGNDVRPQSVQTSAAGDYLNMGNFDGGGCDGVSDADGLSFRLDSGTMNRIKWMVSTKVLAIGTVGNEWTVQGNQQSAMTPQSLLAQRQTNSGSERIRPLMVGLSTLFVERHGRTINEFKYEYTTDSYETSDRSILATHFTDYYSIVDWTFQQMPDQVIWMVRGDGAMLGCTYQREHKVVGWHLHETPGEFLAVTCIPGPRRTDEVWATIKRTIGGVDHIFEERMEDEFTGTTAAEGRFLDSHVVGEVSNGVVSGLGHLEGEVVSVLADGTVHPDCIVSAGTVELNSTEYAEAVVGYNYVSEVRPYLQDIPDNFGVGFARVQRIVNVDIDFYKTLGGVIGKDDSEDGESTENLPFRKPEDVTGKAVPLFTGIYHYGFMEGFDRKAEYFIRQEQPLPMTVRGVVDTIEVQM